MHRLDAGTSGLMVVAKSEMAYTELKWAFRERTVDKRYHALVQGHPDPLRGTVDAPIDRHPPAATSSRSSPAVSRASRTTTPSRRSARRVCSTIRLETGRTHQIRVHMAALRHPCVGDSRTARTRRSSARLRLSRQWLHAWRLGFEHPADGRHVEFTSADPPDLAAALAELAED